MKQFNDVLSLSKNARGCYIIDTVKGCSICRDRPGGCYGDCYANNISKRYGFDFSNPINMRFTDYFQQPLFNGVHTELEEKILSDIKNADMPFIRIGEMGDPSQDWEHTINVCKILNEAGKPIVIITKHWKPIPNHLLGDIAKLNIVVNTSVSALDSNKELEHRLLQHENLKKHCKAIIRIVSCDFNMYSPIGYKLNLVQSKLFDTYPNAIDTIFRPSKQNRFIEQNIINTKKLMFMGSNVLTSCHCETPYLGYCKSCPDMCGINK